MNITLLPEDILNILFKLLTPNVSNILTTCKLFNKIIHQNISHIYEKNTYEYSNYTSFYDIALNIYNYFTNQNITNEKTLTLIKSQYKIYEHESKCKIIVADNCKYLNFIKNTYDNSTLDYVHFYNNLYKFYFIVPTINGYSSVAFYYNARDEDIEQSIACIYSFDNNEINIMNCYEFIIKLTNINSCGSARLININMSVNHILNIILSSTNNYNSMIENHRTILNNN